MTDLPLFLGIDAGSSVTKAALFDLRGRLVGKVARTLQMSRPEARRVEVDPELAWGTLCAVLHDLWTETGIAPSRIAGVGLTGAMVGLWLLDGDGRPVAPGINWEDSRAQLLLEAMEAAEPNMPATIFASSGSALQQGCTLPLLAWMRDHAPDTLARARHAISYKDFLRFRLTGEIAADQTEASVAPGDTKARGFSSRMLSLFGLNGLAHLLGPVRPSEGCAGRVTPEAAHVTGLVEGTPVAIGAGDVPAGVTGMGGRAPGTVSIILGTTCMLGVATDRPVFTPPGLGLLFPLPGDTWFRAMVNVAGTLALDWALDLFCPDWPSGPERYAKAEALVREVPVGANGVTFLPYLSESGIIAPKVSTGARGTFFGLTPTHGRADVLRAVHEGIVLAIVDLVNLLPPSDTVAPVLIAGGGARSETWVQMIADALGRTVKVPDGSEFGALGAAMLAATMVVSDKDSFTAMAPPRAGLIAPLGDQAVAWRAAHSLYSARRDAVLAAADMETPE
ncbi:FGGY-family carbohydrate kinase [Psychromarinibacter sp. S121]|uniref:FGGY-family carbohydrate kinase n=1 Tax=Psychromarinibacter sp. S121 TaxID=3415127 RepID=UPI003C7E8AF7